MLHLNNLKLQQLQETKRKQPSQIQHISEMPLNAHFVINKLKIFQEEKWAVQLLVGVYVYCLQLDFSFGYPVVVKVVKILIVSVKTVQILKQMFQLIAADSQNYIKITMIRLFFFVFITQQQFIRISNIQLLLILYNNNFFNQQIQTFPKNTNKILKLIKISYSRMSSIDGLSKQYDQQNLFQANQDSKKTFKPPSRFNINITQYQKFSSPYFKDHIDQQYVIYRAFNANNFTYLRNLPDNFKRGQILNSRKQKVTKQNQSQAFERTKDYQQKFVQRQKKIIDNKKQKIGTLGYFTKFEYIQSNYQIPKLLSVNQRKQSDKKRNQISQLDFRPSGIQTKLKYEDPFKYLQKTLRSTEQNSSNSNYLFPFHIPQDTYNQFHQSQRRRKLISDSMKLNGDFIPAQKQHVLTKVSKQQIGEIIREIQILLKKYLKDVGFFIGVTKDDYIQILFQQKQKDQYKISIFMSKICEHQMLSKYILRRNICKWGQLDKQKGYLIYCILPNWVKNPVQNLVKK